MADNEAFNLLKGINARKVVKAQNVVTLRIGNSVERALNTLHQYKILSAPVLQDSDNNEPVAFIDVQDIAEFVAQQEENKNVDLRSFKIRDVLNASNKRPFVTLYDNMPLSAVAEVFSQGVHRTALFSSVQSDAPRSREQLSHIISQSDIVAYLAANMDQMNFMSKQTLTRLGYADKDIHKVLDTQSVADGLRALAGTGASHLAVVDTTGKLVANFGPQCLRGLKTDTIGELNKPIREFLEAHKPAWLQPNISKPDQTFGEQIKFFAGLRTHHVWMVNDKGEPVGIVTLTDLMRCILNFKVTDAEKRAARAARDATVLKLPALLLLRVISASKLPKGWFSGKADPYVRVKFPGWQEGETSVVKGTCDPKFDKTFSYEIKKGARGSFIVVEVWDANQFMADDLLGSCRINIDWILDGFGTHQPIQNIQESWQLMSPEGEVHGEILLDLTYQFN